jgi:hypothetical protein
MVPRDGVCRPTFSYRTLSFTLVDDECPCDATDTPDISFLVEALDSSGVLMMVFLSMVSDVRINSAKLDFLQEHTEC